MQVAHVYLDIETTGLDPVYHSVVEIGAVAMDDGGREIDKFQSLTFPGEWAMKNSEPRAFEVSGIDPDEVRRARPIAEVAVEFKTWIGKFGKLHAYPVEFERGFLSRDPWSIPSMLWGDCVLEAARAVMGSAGALPTYYGKPKRPKLSEAAAFFGVKADRFHRALDDARTTALVHQALIEYKALDEARNIMESGM
jgi:DNA polymerase III epsilon subunit-like protein